jgi:hypothetical protein
MTLSANLPHSPCLSSLHMRRVIQTRLIESLFTRRDIQRWIRTKEIRRFKRHSNNLTRHDREILNPRRMCQGERMPYHDILVPRAFLGRCSNKGFYARAPTGLVCEFTARVELAVGVFGEPDGVVSELGAAGVERCGVCQQHLTTSTLLV